ncbi:hypothetical protein OG562_14035 [Streptomyces sp. NBC_01275]|uniref:hypothetical protein n=1 Tax=Streptomyces sp. NBC_01275 TaxID=2903807 RepID=UPI002259BB0A|nr:hypothetical protein [Streptomyces sp. NBC_01275]MCX4762074.1 hypothetical protein [Streptomyces sp. NBC_01275]
MGAGRRRRIQGRPHGKHVPRAVAVAGLAVLAVGGVAACDPGGLSTMSVAYTTDQAATAEIGRRDVDLRWLTCTADYDGDADTTAQTVASVDCRGETADGRDVTVTGKVTRAVDGACVRGDLTADVGEKQLFRVSGLGDCKSATPSPVAPASSAQPGGVRPTVTVTVTETVWCKDGRPGCGPVEGK